MPKTACLSATAFAGGCLLLAGCGNDNSVINQQYGPNPVLPAPTQSLVPDLKVAEVVGWQDGQTPTVPDGLVVTAYARDLANPRTVHTLPNGDVLVVQSKGPPGKPLNRPKDIIRNFIMGMAAGDGGDQETNLITLLRDTNRDGKVDQRSDLLRGLTSPFGVAWHEGTLYVAAADAILAYPYELGQSEIKAAPTILTPLPGGPINHHWTKDLAFSPDGRYLYASVGSNSNAAERGLEAEKGRAAIWRVERTTGAARVFASGLRNPNGLNIHPETGELWTVVNERDELGPDLVPDYLTSVREGGFYGWPWSYFGQHVDERVAPPRPDLVETAISPDYALTSHVAALGLAFTNDSALPEAYRNGAFVGNHGSWNRRTFNGYKVIYIPFAEGRPAGMAQDVVTGFLVNDQARGRPVGLAIDGTGALLIADDAGNTVWRVAAADGSGTPAPIPTDRITTGTAQRSTDARGTNNPAVENGDAPTAITPPAPSQTDIAPAVGPEDGTTPSENGG
ncbi:sorbosone dehydrogenase family protein [Xanthobacteraceae bacterium Astr-EGSB]|uniref:PQQ-dependent sugar dehydrogenase n=1 Tax=Astrobacterium formosum TaxID=3069710 RepID=UPI0027B84A7E|nr:sorbosone dehydrogenase family protein [Xanthobacteraceae bacterium Astr-EGSB]